MAILKIHGAQCKAGGAVAYELGHVPIRMRPLGSLRPAALNDKVYKPVDLKDPDVRALAKSVRRVGLKQPILVTLDDVILAGHRRHVACQLAGLTEVPCIIENIRSTDPDFPRRLVELNLQRVKSLAEVAREEVITANPEESNRVLTEYRKERARVDVDAGTIVIEGAKRRAEISNAKRHMLDAIQAVLRERKKFWPLTDRQIHYALLNNPPLIHAGKPGSTYTNNLKSYKALCELLARARLAGLVPWAAIHDPTRPVAAWNFHRAAGSFIREQLDGFLKYYYRDLQQSQPNHIEIVGEKNTIDSVIRPVAMEYCVPMSIGRGYASLPPRHAMAERFRRSGKEQLVLLVLSDFDPEGEDIAHSFARSMRDDFGVTKIEPIKVALTAGQVDDLDLEPQMTAKVGSSRRSKFVDRHGEDVFELEAVPPETLQELLREAIDGVLDMDAYNAEIDREAEEVAYLGALRRRANESITELE